MEGAGNSAPSTHSQGSDRVRAWTEAQPSLHKVVPLGKCCRDLSETFAQDLRGRQEGCWEEVTVEM